jgi:uncharacterized protein YgiB involved in biofilm formation
LKRSRTSRALACIVLGTSIFALTGCEGNKTDAVTLEADMDCQATEDLPFGMEPAQCEELLVAAKAEHMETAPRYDALDVCEEQHGEGNCQADPITTQSSSGSSFMPFLAGYMIGNIGSAGYTTPYASHPLVSTKSNKFSTTDGGLVFNKLNSSTKVSASSASAKPATTLGKAPMTRATVKATGGFGRSSTSSIGRSSSFGG